MKHLIWIILLSMSTIKGYSQDISVVRNEFQKDTARIEEYVRNEMTGNTIDFRQKMNYLEVEYDKLLNKYYKLLMSLLDDEGKKALKAAQINWIKFQTADRELLDNISKQIYQNMGGGTLYHFISAPLYPYIVKDRAIELYEYYSSVLDSKLK